MAKEATKKSEAITKEASGGLKLADPVDLARDAIAEAYGDEVPFDVTGTEEMGAADVRLATWALNTKGTDNVVTRPNEFLNTVTEEVKPKLRLAILTNHKTRQWRENVDNQPVTRCRSWDGVTGEMEDGKQRQCDGCPDYEWKTDPNTKKRSRRCGDVYNLVAIDRESGEIGVLRVKKAATKKVREFYQRYFHKKRRVTITDQNTNKPKTVVRDYPFFAFETVVGATMMKGDGFVWAEPTFELGGLLPKDELLAYRDLAVSFLEEQNDRLRATVAHADASDVDVDGDVIDTTGGPVSSAEQRERNASEFSDGQPAASESGNRW